MFGYFHDVVHKFTQIWGLPARKLVSRPLWTQGYCVWLRQSWGPDGPHILSGASGAEWGSKSTLEVEQVEGRAPNVVWPDPLPRPSPSLHFPLDKEQGAGRERALAVGCPRWAVCSGIRAVTAEGVGLEAGGARQGLRGRRRSSV